MTEFPRSRSRRSVVEQSRVVALMQADAWLVQHVENAGQSRADLRGEPDALRFAAGERAAFAIQA